MKQKLKKILTVSLAIFLLNNSILVYSAYQETWLAKSDLQVASPKIHILSNTSHIEELGAGKTENNFKVVNFDTNNSISDIDLSYKITVSASKTNIPILWELYQLQTDENGDETKHLVNSGETFILPANIQQTHHFRLVVFYDASENLLEEPVEFFINLEVVQKGSV